MLRHLIGIRVSSMTEIIAKAIKFDTLFEIICTEFVLPFLIQQRLKKINSFDDLSVSYCCGSI